MIGDKKRQFFIQILYLDTIEKKHFKINSFGLTLDGIDSLVTKLYRMEELDKYAINENVEILAFGQSLVSREEKKLKKEKKDVVFFNKEIVD